MKVRGILPGLVFCTALLAAGEATAIPLLNGFGGADGYGTPDHCVALGDDNSYAAPGATEPTAIDLHPAFPSGLSFFGRTVDHFYLNTNGNLTFAAPLATHTATAFPIADQPMIAPWWADVDTRRGGSVCFHLEPGRVVATWHDVASSEAGSDRRDDLQMILTARALCEREGEFNIEFRYHRCEWAGSGGAFAQVGFDAGNRTNYVYLPMSRSAAIADVCTASNVPGGEPGLYRFLIREGYADPGCADAGQPCTVESARGRCATSFRQCGDGVGGSVCVPIHAPRARACDGLDNDCDGAPDDGDELCAAGGVCDHARCLRRCGAAGECPAGSTCTARGGCVETACRDLRCAVGQRCSDGRCVALCDGISCGRGQRCDDGRCVSLCEGVECRPLWQCDADPSSPYVGQCVPHCSCSGCDAGRVCGASGFCVPGLVPPLPDSGVVVDVLVARDASTDVPASDVPAMALDAGASDADLSSRGRLVDASCGCRAGAPTRAPSLSIVALALAACALRRRRR